jgi:hypothetical protein
LPLGSNVAVAPATDTGMRPVAENVLVAGLYRSALALPPPATSTSPLRSVVAVWPDRAAVISPVATQVFGGPSPCAVPAVAAAGIPKAAARSAVAIAVSRLGPTGGNDVTVSSCQANSRQLTVRVEAETVAG